MSVMTAGYTVGAGIVWLAGMLLSAEVLQGWTGGLVGLILPGALLWTVAIAGYLLWTWLGRVDERRLEAALQAAYGLDPDDA